MVAWVLLVIGGLNWLLVGAFGYDLVASLLGDMSAASRTVYVLVGVAAVYVLISGKKSCKSSSSMSNESSAPQM